MPSPSKIELKNQDTLLWVAFAHVRILRRGMFQHWILVYMMFALMRYVCRGDRIVQRPIEEIAELRDENIMSKVFKLSI